MGAAAATTARSSTIIRSMSLTTTYTPGDILVEAEVTGRRRIAHPMETTRAPDTRHDRCLIRPPGLLTVVEAESIILASLEFPRRGRTTRRRRGRPTRILPDLIFPKPARCLTIQAVRI